MAVKLPSPAQMRALQLLREGKLVWGAASPGLFDISIERDAGGGRLLAPVTARKLVDNAWVELRKFNPRKGIYRLSAKGKELSDLLCRCSPAKTELTDFVLLSGIDPSTTQKHNWENERLLCMSCWRVSRCAFVTRPRPGVMRAAPSHGANRYVWGVGAICVKHNEQ